MVGDAFHVNAEEYAAVNTPPGWANANLRRETANLAKRLMRENVRQECRQDHVGAGGKGFPNYKFHKEGTLGPVIIAELDKVLLDAYDLPRNPLIEQMQIIRESSAHRLMGAEQPGPSA